MIRGALRFSSSVRESLAADGGAEGGGEDEEEEGLGIFGDSLAVTTFAAVAASIVVRVGGRSAIVGGLGVAGPEGFDSGPLLEVYNAVQSLECTDPASYVSAILLLLPIWVILRVFCLDWLAIPIAFLSGVTFNSVILGALITTTLSCVGSSAGFALGRYTPWGAKVSEKIRKSQPAVRGVAQLVEKEPVKTVFTARLAPLLPIPIGGYNYVYGGLTGVRWRDFAAGTWLGGERQRVAKRRAEKPRFV